jgi:hypothetical protein
MTASSGGGRPFDLGRYSGPPPLVTASEVLDVPMAIDQREPIWRQVGVLPALTMVAGLFADLDLAAITHVNLGELGYDARAAAGGWLSTASQWT